VSFTYVTDKDALKGVYCREPASWDLHGIGPLLAGEKSTYLKLSTPVDVQRGDQ